MVRPSQPTTIQCKYFPWRLFKRGEVYYADGRGDEHHRGKSSLGTTDHAEALTRLKELDTHTARGLGIAEPEGVFVDDDVTITGGWQLYMDRCARPEILDGVSPNTQKRFRPVRQRHEEFCRAHGIARWSQVTKQTTLDYGAYLVRGYADATIVLECNLLCSIVKWLIDAEQLPKTCEFKLRMSKPQGTTTYCYSKEEVRRMVDYCRQGASLTWMMCAITALATTGMRIGELISLRWTDVDFEAGIICLTDERSSKKKIRLGKPRRIKGKRGRTIPLNPALREVLEKMVRHSDGLVFHGERGGKLTQSIVLKTLKQRVIGSLMKEFPTPPGEIGFEHGVVHSFRHYFTSEAYRHGASDAELMEWLGHRDSKIMDLYRHLRPGDSKRRMRQIDFWETATGCLPRNLFYFMRGGHP